MEVDGQGGEQYEGLHRRGRQQGEILGSGDKYANFRNMSHEFRNDLAAL